MKIGTASVRYHSGGLVFRKLRHSKSIYYGSYIIQNIDVLKVRHMHEK